MLLVLLGVAGAAVLGLLGAIASYNRFVRQRQLMDNAWANVDTELRRRYDLIPGLVEVVRGYASHERATFEEVLRARAAAVADHGPPTAQSGTEGALVGGLQRLLAVSEAYPALTASEQFLALQRELVTTEDRIQAARRLFNGNVRDYNQRTETFPSVLVARLFGFRRAAYFELAPAVATSAVSVPTTRSR